MNNNAICSLQWPGSEKDESHIFSNNSSKIIHIEREQILLKEIVGKLLIDFRILESKFEIFQNDKHKQEQHHQHQQHHQQKPQQQHQQIQQQQQQNQQQQQSQKQMQQNKQQQNQGCNTTQLFLTTLYKIFPLSASQFYYIYCKC